MHALALEQLEHNIELLKPGATFSDVSESAWPIPDKYIEQRYGGILHGVGLCDEYPTIWEQVDWEEFGYDGLIEEGMTFCVESYIGEVGGKEGINVEQQVLITAAGAELLSDYGTGL